MVRRRIWQNPLAMEHIWAIFFGMLVGLGAGLLVIVFKLALHWGVAFFGEVLPEWLGLGAWTFPLALAAAGGGVALMRRFVLPRERYHGVTNLIRAVAYGGLVPYWATPWKALAAVLSISAGASVGPEDPSVQIGASVGAWLSRRLHLSTQRTRLLIGTGAAAGIATAFNAPIAGVFFAIEIILQEFATGTLGTLVLGAVAASVLSRAVFGTHPAFPVPPYALRSAWELPLYLGLGVAAAGVALAYMQALEWGHKALHRLPEGVRPVLVGLVLGLMAVPYPYIRGDSYEFVAEILHAEHLVPAVLLTFLALKIVATALSLGGGFVGGVFAPSLALGAALGGLYGYAMRSLFPALDIQPSAFALVGMAAVLAGAVRAPITAIMLLFEMTSDYHIILPLMAAVVLSIFIAEIFEPESIYTRPLAREGLRLGLNRKIEILEGMRVRDVMRPAPDTLSVSTPLQEAVQRMEAVHAHGLPVVDARGRLYGVLSITDVERAVTRNPENVSRPVREFCTRDVVTVYPEETVAQALRKMVRRDIGRLPVVDPEDPTRLLGWLNRNDILRAYELGLMGQAWAEQQVEHVQLEDLAGTHVLEVEIPKDSPLVGKRVDEVHWPQSMLLASIRRGTELFIPHGETVLQAGDHLNLVTLPDHLEEVRDFLRRHHLHLAHE